MSHLIVHECTPEVFQEIVPLSNMFLTGIRPHLYIHGAPSGSVKVRITDVNDRLISESAGVSIGTLKALTYAHGWWLFDLNTPLRKGETYRIYITGFSGYSFAESDYIGVCKDWDSEKTDQTYSPNDELNAPLDFETWVKEGSNVRVLDFSDSFESSSEPTQGLVSSSGFLSFATDAAYVTNKGSAAAASDAYYNTTTNRLRVHDGTSFRNSEFILTPETTTNLLNNQSAAVDLEISETDANPVTFDGADFHKVLINYSIERSDDDPTSLGETGTIQLRFIDSTWEIERDFEGEDAGVVFSVDETGDVATIQYTTTNFTGGSYSGKLHYEVDTLKA